MVTCDGCGLFPGSCVLSASESMVGLGYFKAHDIASLEYMVPRMHLSYHPSLPLFCFIYTCAVRHEALAASCFQQTHGHVHLLPSTELEVTDSGLRWSGLELRSFLKLPYFGDMGPPPPCLNRKKITLELDQDPFSASRPKFQWTLQIQKPTGGQHSVTEQTPFLSFWTKALRPSLLLPQQYLATQELLLWRLLS